MPHRFSILLILALGNFARAHVGFENDTEIRVFPDNMRVVVRTSIPFAQALLGNGIPPITDEAGQAAAKALLEQSPTHLISIIAGGDPLLPDQVECLSEVQDDIAFILTYPRPRIWPVSVKAEFFPRFGNLESGAMAVFDCTASRFNRDAEPLEKKTVDARDPSLTFSLAPVDHTMKPKEVPAPASEAGSPDIEKIAGIGLFIITAGVVILLARRSWRGLDEGA
ncbi:hypothetical protein JIN84_14695 [Luteolibacter yonseiensis]|uniref:Uncharacterized protein n=1 Tax=Luteolibacter yonseiensis TaxID=1144680 RepID=A0A934R5Z6_9BACT|nr:hypothetical protein [Luteolibacter yonseiensis]MBK1816871.1 hypothetical protein [Luteolibacter yonseiensis]